MYGSAEVEFGTDDQDSRVISIGGRLIADSTGDDSWTLAPYRFPPGCPATPVVRRQLESTTEALLRAHAGFIMRVGAHSLGTKPGRDWFAEELRKENVFSSTVTEKDACITAHETASLAREMSQISQGRVYPRGILLGQARMIGVLAGRSFFSDLSEVAPTVTTAWDNLRRSIKLREMVMNPVADDGDEASGEELRETVPTSRTRLLEMEPLWTGKVLQMERALPGRRWGPDLEEKEDVSARRRSNLNRSVKTVAPASSDGMTKPLGSGDVNAAAEVYAMIQRQMPGGPKKPREKVSSGSGAGGGKRKGVLGLYLTRAHMKKYPLQMVRRYRWKVRAHRKTGELLWEIFQVVKAAAGKDTREGHAVPEPETVPKGLGFLRDFPIRSRSSSK